MCSELLQIFTLKADIEEIEKVSAMGGFYYKDWIISGRDIPEQFISVQLPGAISVDEERALGMMWDVKKDEFYMKSNSSVCSLVQLSLFPCSVQFVL